MSTPAPATTEWVPLWDLNGGVNLDYKGAWAAGTYKDGEIVVHNGIAYLCVRQTTRTPTPWPAASSYGTSLPASPVDGQEAILVDSVTAPNYQWRFRYNAQSSSAYKWEFIGGASAVSNVIGGESTSSTSYVDLATSGPAVTIPRAGDFFASWGCALRATGAAMQLANMGLSIAGAEPGVEAIGSSAADAYASVMNQIKINLSAGVLLRAKYKSYNGVPVLFLYRHLSITPVRVS